MVFFLIVFKLNIYLIFLEEEADLWIFSKIGSHVMNSFCDNVGNLTQLDIQIARQFNADIGK